MPLAIESRGNSQRVEDSSSRLFSKTAFEPQYELEKVLSSAFAKLQDILGLGSEKAMHASLQERIAEGVTQRAETLSGLLYGILVDVQSAGKYLGCISFVTRDGWSSSLAILQCLVTEKYPKLLESVRVQMLWLLRQLVTLGVGDLEPVFLDLLRQIAGGDLSHSNVWLAATLIEIFQNSQAWLYGSQLLLTSVLYTYLRILPDHAMARNSVLNDLRQSEATLCAQILRDKFPECMTIGRDLVRLIRDVSSMQEFENVWKDLLSDPGAFNTPAFADLAQLYLVRTPPRFIASRVTPDMETQLRFMLSHVRMGNQRRYQTWFAQRFLSAPESETLVPDLVRFICCCVHPTNQILRSDILPRWAILGWLLKCCKSNHVEASAKLALLYDWLFFATKSDNIMNIEPAILLMVHSIPKYADMTNSLLDFLFLLIEHYDKPRRELLQRGVTASIDILVGKGVVHSLEPLSASPLVALPLREKLIARFPAYCNSELPSPVGDLRPSPTPDPATTSSIPPLTVSSSPPSTLPQTVDTVPPVVVSLTPASAPSAPSAPAECVATEVDRLVTSEHRPPGAGLMVKSASAASPSPGPKKRKRVAAEQDTAALLKAALERFRSVVSGNLQEAPAVALEQLLALYMHKSQIDVSCAAEVGGGGEVGLRDVELATSDSAVACAGSDSANGVAGLFEAASAMAAESLAQALEDLSAEEGSVLFAELREGPDGDSMDELSITSAVLDAYIENVKLEPVLLRWHDKGLPVRARLLCCAARAVEQGTEEVAGHGGLNRISDGKEVEPPVRSIEIGSQGDEEKEDGLVVHVGEGSDEEGELMEREDAARAEEGESQSMEVVGGSVGDEERMRSGGNAECSSAGQVMTRQGSGLCGGSDGRRWSRWHGGQGQARAVDSSRAFLAYEAFLRASCSGDAKGSEVEGSGATENGESLRANGESAGEGERTEVIVEGLVYDLRTLFLWNKSRMIWALPWVFRHLPSLSCCNIEIFQLLLATADPFELYDLELRLSLAEFTPVGPGTDTALKALISSSLDWDSAEQHSLWQLLCAEVKVGLSSPPLALRLLTLAAQQVDLSGTPEATGGLLRLLHSVEPTPELLSVLLQLPAGYGKLSAAVLVGWATSHKAVLNTLVRQQLQAAPADEGKFTSRNGHSPIEPHVMAVSRLLALFGGEIGSEDSPGAKADRSEDRGQSSQGGGEEGDGLGRPSVEASSEEIKVRERSFGVGNHSGETMKVASEPRRVEQLALRETRSRTLRSST